jgi:hypothetical protein
MPLEGRPLTAPVDLRIVLRAGIDSDPHGVAIVDAGIATTWHLHPHGLPA